MSVDVAALIERARIADPVGRAGQDDGQGERAKLERIAQEFESMLLVQVLRGMRTSGSWETEDEADTLGAESLFETLDVELASHLARAQGLGLSTQLLAAFDRMNAAGPRPQGSGLSEASVGEASVPHEGGSAAALGPEASGLRPETLAVGSSASVPPVEVTSSFGWRRDPFTGDATFHRGVDLRAAYGQEVLAVGDGQVVFSGDQGGYGTTVVIEHADGTRTRYAHLSATLVSQGETVSSGQLVGRAGRSGRATGTHLHLEVIAADGRHVDPRRVLGS
ncbi:MAG: peptidoglycan DD-metalloendopeptidase family protein [Acidobacteria bacterium]|nr:peptidoglycan DD-metalloendopeptidase family protein [Acidobacteriota bacterium]